MASIVPPPESRPPRAAPGPVWIYHWNADSVGSVGTEEDLPEPERARAGRFATPELRRRFVIHHLILRNLLSRATRRPAREIAIRRGCFGKPYLCDGAIGFNLAHAGAVGIAALSRHRAVGVDIEPETRKMPHLEDLARRFFSPRETDWLQSIPGPARRRSFLRLWVHKEAWLKARGTGIQGGLENDVHLRDNRLETFYPIAGFSRAWLREIAGIPECVAAVVSFGQPGDVVVRPWSPAESVT